MPKNVTEGAFGRSTRELPESRLAVHEWAGVDVNLDVERAAVQLLAWNADEA
jgi:hypothetical protein